MKKFKRLFHVKRILAMMLAAAMVVTMMPSTVYASTGTDVVTEEAQVNVQEAAQNLDVTSGNVTQYDVSAGDTKETLYTNALLADVMPGTKAADVAITGLYLTNAGDETLYTYSNDETSPLSYTAQVKEAATDKVLADTDVLVNTKDYVLDLTVAFTAAAENTSNYVIQQTSVDIVMGSMYTTSIDVSAGDISHVYTGSAIAAPVAGADYTAAVKYWDSVASAYVTIENATVTGAWYDSNYNAMNGAPVDAGTYYYQLSYAGEKGLYASVDTNIKVVIDKATITIKPVLPEDVNFYNGSTVYDVLSKVDYEVLDASGKPMAIDKSTFWGARGSSYYTQPYEPVFKVVQVVKTDDGYTYNEMDEDAELSSANSYHVVFTGDKAVYDLEDGYAYSSNINNYNYESGNYNYTVDTSSAVLDANYAAVEVKEGYVATIDVSKILGADGAGSSKENPIKIPYDGTSIYDSRADFMKAVVSAVVDGETVKVTEGSNDALTYTWYATYDGGETYVQKSSYYGSPIYAADYKLQITYKDSDNVYHADAVNVYYTVEKQEVYAVPTGDYTVWAGTGIDDFLTGIGYDFILYETATDDRVYLSTRYYTPYWVVEKLTDAETNTWTVVTDESETFADGTSYRLAINEIVFDTSYDLGKCYSNDPAKNSTLPINVKVMGTNELTVTVNEEKLTTKTKVYDGVAIDISKDIANGLITVEGVEGIKVPAYYGYWLDGNYEYVEAPVNAGTYTYWIGFDGDTDYQSLYKQIVTVTITPKELTVTPYVSDTVVAGTAIDKVIDAGRTAFEGMIAADESAFTYVNYAWDAVDYIELIVIDVATGSAATALTTGNTYKVVCGNVALNDIYATNYTLKLEEVSFTPVRGNATVKAVSADNITAIMVKDSIDGMKHTITTETGIPYYYNESGNLVAIKIQIPAEYTSIPSTALYEKSIVEAGGYVQEVGTDYIVVVFDASGMDTTEFGIRWEDGYLETFVLDFTDATLLADLTKAVAPKSIAFQKVAKKMAVGEEQQLDVKLKKTLESDIILLTYEVSDDKILYVDEYGYVTALAKGKANVTVYASHYVDGELVPIQPAKKATTTITVTDVTAPKITTLSVLDTEIYLNYSATYNGFRREIYVMEGKKSAVQFEEAIASMKNGRWEGIFATAPYFDTYYGYGEQYGLEPNTAYTVYVRNVSKIRDVEEGYVVSESAAGSVKSFTTSKIQADYLYLSFDAGVTSDDGYYNVPLSKGSFTTTARARFENDEGYAKTYALPLSGDAKKTYAAPKVTYGVYNYNGGAASIASVDKKGKVTLKGVGQFVLVVYDANGYAENWYMINITATADSIAAKNKTLKVGQSVDLSELLIYKQGKKVLTGNVPKSIVVDEALETAFANSKHFKLEGTTVTAIAPGGNLNVTLKDAGVPGKTATVTLKSGALDAVKNLKSVLTTDQFLDLRFSHTGGAEAFRITVKDGRGSVVSSVYAPANQIIAGNNTYAYRVSGLTKKSKYTVTVAALYGDVVSKETKKVFTTTLLPVSYAALTPSQYNTGVGIFEANEYYDTINYTPFISGNTYTLSVGDAYYDVNWGAIYGGTDKLTWTSSDKTVATVKSNGTIGFATLTAVGQGSTLIEVKSKNTKAVIARYWLYVDAVGNAYDYFGTNTPMDRTTVGSTNVDLTVDVQGDGTTVLSMGNDATVSAEAGSYTWLKFTAPSAGSYTFTSYDNDGDPEAWFFNAAGKNMVGNGANPSVLDSYSGDSTYGYGSDDDGAGDRNFSHSITLSAGETVYIAVGRYSLSNSVTVTVTVTRN